MSADISPLQTGARARRWGAWYVAEHKIRSMRGYIGTLVATAIGTPFLYLFAFGVGLATLITGNVGPVPGVTYLQFVAFKWNAIFIGMNAAPISGRQIINGVVLFVGLRMLVTTSVYYLMMLLFGAVEPGWSALTIVAGLLCGFAFSPVAAYAATIQEDRGQFAILQRVIILPLTLFSGTLFPLTQLPIFLQWIGWLSPLWHASELGRQFVYGPTEPIWLTVAHIVYLIGLGVLGWQLCVRIATRRLDK